ncbi:MAG: phage tail spike protein [Bacillota bacterium]
MPELLIFDPADNLVAVLSNEAEEACFVKTAPFKEVRNQGSFFEFVAQGDHEDSQHLVAENQVAFLDKDGYFRLFVIKEPEQTNGLNGPQIRCVCEPALNELNEEWIEDVRPYNTTLADAQRRALAGTRWKPGITAELGINSINYFYISVNEAIQENINTWGGELRDRIEIEDNKIIGRYIDILPRRGQDSGKIWEIDKDIISLSHKVQSYPKTALYGRGASLETDNGGFTRKITFADVEWKVANGDPVDKPKGQEWVGDPGALAAFGRLNEDGTKRHRKGLYENGQQEDPAVLLQETWEALQQQKHQFHNYEMDVFLLEQISGYEHEKVRLGDTTFAIDRSFANPIEVEQRVISFEYDVADPDNTGTVELGQYIDLYSDDDRLDQIEAQLNDKSGIWDQGGGPVTDDKIANITPTAPANLSATGGFEVVQLYWDFNNAIYIANYEVYASQVQGFVPDPSNLVFRGKTSAFSHKVAKNQQWYYRVRAVNTHGVAGPYTGEVMAQTARIISDDILFGPEIAAELRELSKTADLIANGAIKFIQLANDVQTPINNAVNQANLAVNTADLATQNALDAISKAQSAFDTASDASIKADEASGQVSSISQTVQGLQTAVSNKAEQSVVTQLAGVVDSKISTIDADAKFATQTQLTQTSSSLTSTITQVQNNLDNLKIGGTNLVPLSQLETSYTGWYPWGSGTSLSVTTTGTGETSHNSILVRNPNANAGSPIGIRGGDNRTFKVLSGKTYTLSFIVTANGNLNYAMGYNYLLRTSTTANYRLPSVADIRAFPLHIVSSGIWFREVHITFTVDFTDLVTVLLGAYPVSNGDAWFRVSKIKMEEGTKNTPWSPAPEDMATTSQISQLADNINLRVEKDKVIQQINVSTEGILIAGNKIWITGQTVIDNGTIGSAAIADASITSAKIKSLAVGTAALENASVTNAKIANLAVGTAQIQDAAIINAKIANLAVDDAKIADISVTKLKAGTINADLVSIANNKIRMNNNGLYVYKNSIMGASLVEGNLTFYDQSNAQQIGMFAATVWSDGNTKGISMNMEQNRYISFGRYVDATTGYTPMMLLNPATNMAGNVQGIHMNLPIRMNSDVWLGTNSIRFGLNNNHNHAAIYKSSSDDLLIASYQSVGLAHITSGGVTNTKLSIHPNEVKVNVDTTFHGLHIRSYADLWLGSKALRFGNDPFHNHAAIWKSTGNDLIIGSYQAIGLANIDSGGVANTKFTVASNVNDSWQDLDMHGWKLLRVGEVDTTIGRMVADSNATYIQHNTEIRATRYKSTTYVPVRASSFPTGTSLRENKTDIEIFDEDALSVLRNINTYLYRVKGDEFKEHKQLGLMVDETPRVLHGEAGDSIEMYALSTYLVRGVQQLAIEFDTHADDINWLKIENQYLSQKVKSLEQRVRSLEDQLYAAQEEKS